MYCVIDIGSNTIRLVICRVENGVIRPILSNKHTAGLAGYVDKKNFMSPEGVQKLISVLREFQGVLDILPDCPVYPFATASLRNIVNTEQVLETVRRETGFTIQVLSGYEEAMLDYRGAIRHVGEDAGLLVDIGGGSTELVFFKDASVLAAHSIPLGSLNLYSRFVSSGILPNKKELRAMQEEVRRVLEDSMPPAREYVAQPLCGVGGTARGTLALFQSMRKDGGDEPIYETRFLDKVLDLAEENPQKLLRRILKIAPDRVHTLVPGVVILNSVAKLYGSHTAVTSPYGVREGYLSYMLEKEGILCD